MSINNDKTSDKLISFKSNHIEIDIFLLNGIRLTGFIDDVDDESIIYKNGQLIMRNAIATVQRCK